MKLPIDIDNLPQKERVYIVGGSIRDLLYGRSPVDYDLAIDHEPASFARSLAARISGHVVEFGQHGHTILRVVGQNHYFDIQQLNGQSIADDLNRRDFTINAMALEVSTGRLLDPAGGRKDLAAGKVRMVSPDVFRKDPVRLVRAYRMAAALNFTIETETQTAICRDADLIRKSAAERIREEFFKIIDCDRSHAQLILMAQSGLLFNIIPELSELKNCLPEDNFAKDLFERTLNAYNHLEKMLGGREPTLPKHAKRLIDQIEAARAATLKCSVLLQHIGRPSARPATAGGIRHFRAHAGKSAAMARRVCRRLRFSNRRSDAVQFLIRNQLHPFFIFKAKQNMKRVDRPFIRFFMRCGDCTPDILLLSLSGFTGYRDAGDPATHEFRRFIMECLERYDSVLLPRSSRLLPINGNDLISRFGLKPSAEFRKILKTIEEEHLAREAFSRGEALEVVEKLLRKKALPMRFRQNLSGCSQ